VADMETRVLRAKIQARLGNEPIVKELTSAATELVKSITLSKLEENDKALECVMLSLSHAPGQE